MPPEASSSARSGGQGHGFAHLREIHVVEQDHGGAVASSASASCSSVATSISMKTSFASEGRARSSARVMPPAAMT
jgi:hypothetical protein